ncbi:DUF4124 domain-containing protein [soil metagenome]
MAQEVPLSGPLHLSRLAAWQQVSYAVSMRLLILCCLLVITGMAHAAVYKWTDAEGNVQFSDKPHPGAEEIKELKPQTYEAAPVKESESPKEAPQEKFAGYKKVEILAPANDETIWDNIGSISVKVGLAPDLQVALGHKVVLSVDGNPSEGAAATAFTLPNMDRGTHSIQVTVVDDSGAKLSTSSTVTFHLKKHSVLLGN